MSDTADTNAGSCGSSVLQRDLWRQARQHINEYEQKTAELQLDRQQHEKALKAKKEELEKTRASTATAEREAISINRKTMDLQREELATQRDVQSAINDTRTLNDQLQVAKQRLEQLKKDRAQMNEGFQQHLAEQRAVVEQYTAHRQAASTE